MQNMELLLYKMFGKVGAKEWVFYHLPTVLNWEDAEKISHAFEETFAETFDREGYRDIFFSKTDSQEWENLLRANENSHFMSEEYGKTYKTYINKIDVNLTINHTDRQIKVIGFREKFNDQLIYLSITQEDQEDRFYYLHIVIDSEAYYN